MKDVFLQYINYICYLRIWWKPLRLHFELFCGVGISRKRYQKFITIVSWLKRLICNEGVVKRH